MRKILLFSQFFYPDRTGTGKVLAELFRALDKDKYAVDVVSSRQEYHADGNKVLPVYEEVDGVRIFRSFRWFASKDNAVGRIYTYLMVLWCSFWTCIRYGLAKDKDILVSVSNPPIMPLLGAFLKRRHQKFIYILHDLYPDIAIAMHVVGAGHPFARVMFWVNRYVFQHVDQVVVLGRDMEQHLMRAYKVPAEKLTVITNWASDDFGSEPQYQQGKKFRVLYTGNMGLFHNLDLAVEAVRGLSDVEMVFVGDGASKAELLKRCQGMENVKFYSFLDDAPYREMLASADALLVSLEANLSGLAVPSKFYTYLAAGRPILCISDRNTEMAMTIEEFGCGFVISHGDMEGFHDDVIALKNDRKLSRQQGVAARNLFKERYQKEQIVKRYEMLFEK